MLLAIFSPVSSVTVEKMPVELGWGGGGVRERVGM